MLQAFVIIFACKNTTAKCEDGYEEKMPEAFFGWLILGANWVPGVIAAMHIFSSYRSKIKHSRNTFFMAILVFLFYPIVPTLLYIMTLWQNDSEQKDMSREQKEEGKKEGFFARRSVMEYARISQALEGGVESPLQFTIQVSVIWMRQRSFKSIQPFLPGLLNHYGQTAQALAVG